MKADEAFIVMTEDNRMPVILTDYRQNTRAG